MQRKKYCEFCDGPLVQTRGEYVCSNCGAVNNIAFITRDGSDQVPWDHKMALGKRVHIVDGLGSYIGFHNDSFFQDRKGSSLSSKKQYKFRKLKKRYNLRIKISNHETDYRSLMSLNRACAVLGVSDTVKKRAAYLYKIVAAAERSKEIEKISNHIVLAALCLLVAVRESGSNAPLRLREIVKVFKDLRHRVSGKAIVKLAQSFPPELGISVRVRRSEDYLHRITSQIIEQSDVIDRLESLDYNPQKYSQKLLRLSQELLKGISLRTRGGRNPYIFAVSVVYCADRIVGKLGNHRQVLTQKRLASICDVAEYSIRDHHRSVLKDKLKEKIKLLVPSSKKVVNEQPKKEELRFPLFF